MMKDRASYDQAKVVVVGGGIIGASIAYHLCLAGVTDVLILERNEICSGATARSAGLLLHAQSNQNVTRMVSRTCEAIKELEDHLGEPLDFKQVGTIRAVHGEDHERAMGAAMASLDAGGIESERLDAGVARTMCPWLDFSQARSIAFVPADGYIDAARLCAAYVRAARLLGARTIRGVHATGAILQDGVVVGVRSDRGDIRCETLVQACGAWSGQFSRSLGWGFPATPTRSHYWITAPDGNGRADQPNVLLPDYRAYFRTEVGGLLVGFQELVSRTFDPYGIGSEMDSAELYDEERDTDLLIEHAAALRSMAPTVDEWRFPHHVAGLSMYTPDGKFVIGHVEGMQGLLVAGGCCGLGVAASGGIGHAIAALASGDEPAVDLTAFRPDRFGAVDAGEPAFRARCSAARSVKSRA